MFLRAMILLLVPALAHAESFTGRVVGVIDGDTFRVRRDRRTVKVRLHDVDCPDKRQPHAKQAKSTSKRARARDLSQ